MSPKEQPIWAITISKMHSESSGEFAYFKKHLTYAEAENELQKLQADLAVIKAMPNAEWFLTNRMSFEIVEKR